MLATTWLGSILSLTKKATQNKNARLSFFHVPSQTNCFFKHLQNQNQSRKPNPAQNQTKQKLDSHRLALLNLNKKITQQLINYINF